MKKMTKDEQIELLKSQLDTVMASETEVLLALDGFKKEVVEYECLLGWLENKISKVQVKQTGRKEQVLRILFASGHVTVDAIAQRLGISARNVSSQMTYLRRDGHAIATDSLGRKFLEGK